MSVVPLHPPPLPPAPVSFSGDRREFFRLVRNGTLLELVTFGFYRFWLATDIRRHLWSHTSIDGDAPEYTGRGRELLVGFLFALAILVPVYVAYFLIGIEAERAKAFASFPLFVFFYLFGQFAIYRARRYRLTRTVWRGVRFWMDGSGWAYAWRAMLWAGLGIVTLGLALPWREAALERYKMRHCHYGDLPGHFEGHGSELFKRGWKLWLVATSPIIILIAGGIAGGLSNAASNLFGFLMLGWLVALPFVYGAFKAIEWRWWISGIRFGEVSFKSDLSNHALYGLYWKAIGWFALGTCLLGAYVAVCFYFSPFAQHLGASPAVFAEVTQQNYGMARLFAASSAAGYLVYILAMNVVMRVYLSRDVWARVVASSSVYRLDAVANVAAKGELAGALGEGFADSLDVAGF